MQYQLVLQFRGDALGKFHAVPDVAGGLAKALGGSVLLDGEDVGDHGANLFLYTEDPADTFYRAVEIFGSPQQCKGFAAAYRQVASNEFKSLWPTDATGFRMR